MKQLDRHSLFAYNTKILLFDADAIQQGCAVVKGRTNISGVGIKTVE